MDARFFCTEQGLVQPAIGQRNGTQSRQEEAPWRAPETVNRHNCKTVVSRTGGPQYIDTKLVF